VVGQGLGVGLEHLLEAVEHALLLGAVAILVDLELGQIGRRQNGKERQRHNGDKEQPAWLRPHTHTL
jgi:hypothetical protein